MSHDFIDMAALKFLLRGAFHVEYLPQTLIFHSRAPLLDRNVKGSRWSSSFDPVFIRYLPDEIELTAVSTFARVPSQRAIEP